MNFLLKVYLALVDNYQIIILASALFSLSAINIQRKSRYFVAFSLSFLAVFSILFYKGIVGWLAGVGGDSFIELNNFDMKEAGFWLESFYSSLLYMQAPTKITILVVSAVIPTSILMYYCSKLYKRVDFFLALSILAAHIIIAASTITAFQAGRSYISELNAAFKESPAGFSQAKDIDLFVYIGESTSSLNMSLYGYPIMTTPVLDQLYKHDDNFIRFDKVRSTSSHTSPSLLRSLSIPTNDSNSLSRWGIANILLSAGVKARLYSVQPLNGSWASFAKYNFGGMNMDLDKDQKYKGNISHPKIKDHELLVKAMATPGVVFFHSYAGHGPYMDFIDESLSKNPLRPTIDFNGVVGSRFNANLQGGILEDISSYDRAITYIDRNVGQAILSTKQNLKPAVFIYFSDHGDSVYTKRGHESSMYIDEMTTVPLILYFNDAYKEKYPSVYLRYKKAAESPSVFFLDQISPTILDVLQIKSERSISVPSLSEDRPHPNPTIMDRRTTSGTSGITFEPDKSSHLSQMPFYGGTPEPTYISQLADTYKYENVYCYHRSNSFAKALRGASVAECLEVDLVVESGKLSIYHPPSVSTGFDLDHVFSIASSRQNKIWIDSKNIDDPQACLSLASYLETQSTRVGQILVEFPPTAISQLGQLAECGRRMRVAGSRLSFYVPTHLSISCASAEDDNGDACTQLTNQVTKAINSGLFTDLSFDFAGYEAIKRIKNANTLTWNTWAVAVKDVAKFPRKDFDFIILDTSFDPNSY